MELLVAASIFLVVMMLGAGVAWQRQKRMFEHRLLLRIGKPEIEAEPIDTGIIREQEHGPGALGYLIPGARLLHWLQTLLRQAAVHSSATGILLLTFVLTAVGAAAGFVWKGESLSTALPPALALGSTPLLYIMWRRRKRLRAFDLQLPEVLDMLKASLEAGHTLQRALQVGVDEFSEPAAAELRLVLEQNRLGIPLERSLDLMLERLPDENLRFLVMAVKIQAQAGTGLANIVGELARTVRDRHRMEMKVRVLTAQPRITGIAAGLMPILLAVGMNFVNPEHVHMLLFDPAGVMISKIAAVLEITAFIVIYRMVRLDY